MQYKKTDMKILLIEPPFERFIGQRCEWYPIGLTSIATLLHEHGYTTKVYNAEHDNSLRYINTEVYLNSYNRYKECLNDDGNYIWQEIIHAITEFDPDIVGISVKSVKIPTTIKIAEICKRINKNIIVVTGGFHATNRPEDLLRSEHIDIVVRGEGEETFLQLVNSISSGSHGFDNINGISFKGTDGAIINTQDRELMGALDNIPFPMRELIWGYGKYTPEQLGWIMTSRGCPYDCSYCNSKTIWNRRVRFVGLDRILEEIRYLKKAFNVTHITFMDDSFTVNRKRILEFCQMLIEQKIGITWSCLTRADLVDEEIVCRMKAAGCVKFDIGIESGSERIQKLINKGIDFSDVRRAAGIFKKCGMFWTGFFMMGFPTETKDDILKTLSFMKEVRPNWAYLSIFTPYPGSKFYDMAKNDGMISDDDDRSSFSHQSPNNCFSKDISNEEFRAITKVMFKEFNSYNNSLASLLRRAQSRKYHKNPKNFIRDARKVLSWLKN